MMKNRTLGGMSILAAAATLALGVTTLTPAEPAVAAVESIQASRVAVSVSCSSSGDYGWNATITDGSSNTTYPVYFVRSYVKFSTGGSGVGGPFSPEKVGNLVTGKYGIGTSSTFYGSAGNTATYVQITAKVGSITGTGSDYC